MLLLSKLGLGTVVAAALALTAPALAADPHGHGGRPHGSSHGSSHSYSMPPHSFHGAPPGLHGTLPHTRHAYPGRVLRPGRSLHLVDFSGAGAGPHGLIARILGHRHGSQPDATVLALWKEAHARGGIGKRGR